MSQPWVILATGSYDNAIKFRDAKSERCYRTIHNNLKHSTRSAYIQEHIRTRPISIQHINRLEIDPDKCSLASAGNSHIRLFDVNSNSPQRGHTGPASDGCALFWREDLCTLLYPEDIEFQKSGLRDNVAQLSMLQIQLFLKRAHSITQEWNGIPFVFCGDLNSGPVGNCGTRGEAGEPLITTYHSQYMGTVDYIWHSEELVLIRVVETLPIGVLRKIGGLLSEKWGSDHLALVVADT